MSRAPRSIAAAVFKARCLALLDEVGETRETLVVTKRGRPVARVVPSDEPLRRSLRGSVKVRGDLLAPLPGAWDAAR